MIKTSEILCICYGNDLRGDDAVGRMAANQIEEWALPNVEVLSLHQLSPELALTLSEYSAVIFVDAHLATKNSIVEIQPIAPLQKNNPVGHMENPVTLLALAESLYEWQGEAWTVTIPAFNFEFGAPLSAATALYLEEALLQIRELLQNA